MLNRQKSSENVDKLHKAQVAYQRFRTQCFWSYKKNLVLRNNDIPWVAEGLRKNGGKEGFLIAGELCR